MKNFKRIAISLWIVILAAAPAFAGQTAQGAGLFTWLFIGFCGLIVICQVIPAVIMGFGMIKGAISHNHHPHHH